MKVKKLIILAAFFILVVGCNKETQKEEVTSIHDAIINNGYDMLDTGFYFKVISSEDNVEDSYAFSVQATPKFFRLMENDLTIFYFFEEDWGSIGGCDYSLKDEKSLYGTECSAEDITKIKDARQFFEDELEKMDITTEDLLKLVVDETEMEVEEDI